MKKVVQGRLKIPMVQQYEQFDGSCKTDNRWRQELQDIDPISNHSSGLIKEIQN